jgi:hypothetical protein
MVTLHIEHPITDYPTWRGAFDGFAEVRRENGVRAERVGRPMGEPNAIVVDLDFDTADAAAAFLAFLESVVWTSPDASPALAGRPRTVIVEAIPA